MDFALKIGVTGVVGLLLACSEPPPPPSVDELISDRILLDATMVRCSANRSQRKYDPECVNAREAVNRIARVEEEERRGELEAQSERKREALRRTQRAAALARQRAAEAAKRREEEAYLRQFGEQPGAGGQAAPPSTDPVQTPVAGSDSTTPPAEASEPAVETPPPAETQDLNAIREELKRRQEPHG